MAGMPAQVKAKQARRPKKAIQGRGQNARLARRKDYEEELQELEERLAVLDPRAASTSSSATNTTKFSEFPLTQATLSGLSSAYFHTATSIQARSLPYVLKGRDLLASARTGSGKTLAFLIPLLDKLYRAKWGPNDGLGALVISPTRELAVQIFEVLRKIGHQHSFSAGLVIGGKNLRDEQDRLSRMNILIATPGRLLQHMDQTLSFDVSNLQMLVLDEADRILDLGFSKTLDAIVSNLPSSHGPNGRQTLLFSATQTDSIQALARLSLNDPVYISVRNESNNTDAIKGTADGAKAADEASTDLKAVATKSGFGQYETSANLEQFYMVVDLDRKIDVLWTFIKSHLACKILVFLSSCKQVRFVYEAFRHLRPGTSLLHLHGKQKQTKRLEIYSKFTAASHAVLFATDIASRGLDFPSVNWVVQLDCPEDVATYIHRVGRTARYNSKGKGLLMLLPSEKEGFEKRLREKRLLSPEGADEGSAPKGTLRPIKMNSQKQDQTIHKQIQSLLFRFNELKTLAQKSFVSYLRSIYLQKDKSVFKIASLADDKSLLERYARSLGLAGSPKIKFKGVKAEKEVKEKKNKRRAVEALKKEFGMDDIQQEDGADALVNKVKKASSTKAPPAKAATEDDFDETSDEEPSDPEEAEDSDEGSDADDDDDRAAWVEGDGAEALSESSSEGEEHEQPTATTSDGKPAISKSASKASTSLLASQNGSEDDADDDGDFLTVAPKQRHLEIGEDDDTGSGLLPMNSEDVSKRKLKQGLTKKGLKALRGTGDKLVFDESGTPHALYELVDDRSLSKEELEAMRRKFVQEQGGRMREVDVEDKEAIKALRREKKLERKAREREVDGLLKKGKARGDEGDGFVLDDDLGEVVPDFDDIDLPSASEDDDNEPPRQSAYKQDDSSKRKRDAVPANADEDEDDLEEQALKALRKKSKR